jgi:hypothetical protein
MGWCSATEIMDTALEAAEAAVEAALDAIEWGAQPTRHGEQLVDDALRPFVARLAAVLRNNDWDCIEESDYFDRFQQEMLGHDDSEHAAYLVEQVKDAADYQSGDLEKWTAKLAEHKRKMGNWS